MNNTGQRSSRTNKRAGKGKRKVQRMTLHREIMREAAVCSRMKPRNILDAGASPMPQTAEAKLRETLKEVTPGPYGFQSYGRRTKLATMAVGDGQGEAFAIFTRDEDAKAFARAMDFAVDALAAADASGEKAGLTQAAEGKQEDATRAMLAALAENLTAMEAAQTAFRVRRELQFVKSLDRPIRETRAAIAQAEAAGITVPK